MFSDRKDKEYGMLSKKNTNKVERPVKVLQFGEGNFLRAFVDYMIDIANEAGEYQSNFE